MHELSLVSSILDIIEDYASQDGFRRVNNLRLSCGRLSGVDLQCLRFAFEVLSRETRSEGATLEIDFLPIVISCLSCGKDTEVKYLEAACPECGSENVLLAGGTEELRLLELDVN